MVTDLTEQPHGNTSEFHNTDVFVHPTSIFCSLNISYGCTQDFVFGQYFDSFSKTGIWGYLDYCMRNITLDIQSQKILFDYI